MFSSIEVSIDIIYLRELIIHKDVAKIIVFKS